MCRGQSNRGVETQRQYTPLLYQAALFSPPCPASCVGGEGYVRSEKCDADECKDCFPALFVQNCAGARSQSSCIDRQMDYFFAANLKNAPKYNKINE